MLPNHEMAQEWALRSTVHFSVPEASEPDPNRLAQFFFMEAAKYHALAAEVNESDRVVLSKYEQEYNVELDKLGQKITQLRLDYDKT